MNFTADPEIGRFISQDSYRGELNDPGQWHLYAYCANNPINYTDPSGHSRHQWVYMIVKFGQLKTLANSYDSKSLSSIIAKHINDYLEGKIKDVYLAPLGKFKAYRLLSKALGVVDIIGQSYKYKKWCANRKSIAVAKAIRVFHNKEYRRKGGKRKVIFGTRHKRTGRGVWVLTGETYFNLAAC